MENGDDICINLYNMTLDILFDYLCNIFSIPYISATIG